MFRACYSFIYFYIGAHGHHGLPMGGILSLCGSQQQLCGSENVVRASADMVVSSKWLKMLHFWGTILLNKILVEEKKKTTKGEAAHQGPNMVGGSWSACFDCLV